MNSVINFLTNKYLLAVMAGLFLFGMVQKIR